MKRAVKWSELGKPERPGRILIDGLGFIEISKQKIELAHQHGGDPSFELTDISTAACPGKYRLGKMEHGKDRPAQTAETPWHWEEYGANRYPE